MIVHRYQNSDGVGPYFTGLFKKNEKSANHDFPIKSYMTVLYNAGIYRFGLLVHQLENWFSVDEKKIMKQHGFTLCRFDASNAHIVHGRNQVAFNVYESKIIK